MDLVQRFQQYINEENLFQKKGKLLIAVSGGVDSVVLCELCKRSGYDFEIAHCNFQLRGTESDRDEQFVKGLGEKYDVEVFVKKFETEKYAAENKSSIQAAARELRYTWFLELLKPPTFLLTAHHLDDNIETLLMNFFKGTGINGLRGILPKHDQLIRPLLFAWKEELRTFAETHQLKFVEDSSNASDKYTRNYFRNQLIPSIQKVFPQAEENLAHNLQRFREIELLYRQSIDLHKSTLLEQKGKEQHIPVLKLKKLTPLETVLYEIIKEYNFTAHQVDEVKGLLQSESGKYISSSTHRIIRNRNWLIISPLETSGAENILIEENDNLIVFPDGQLQINKQARNPQSQSDRVIRAGTIPNLQAPTTNFSVQLDASLISFPLLLRKWKKGDYFYPLGMQKKKKLSRFFIDQKLSLTQKERVWVLEMNKKIIWVAGMRIDDRFKITDQTISILQLNLICT